MAFKGDLDALILGVLQSKPSHGYDISKSIREMSQDALRLGEGQLYPALHKLEHSGLIVAEWQQQTGKPAKKIYAITEQGAARLESLRKEWQKFATGVGAVLNLTLAEVKPHA